MTTLKVEQQGQDLVLRLPPDAQSALGLHAGDDVEVGRAPDGELFLAAIDIDHQLRLVRSRAVLRRYRNLL
jgi:antitoxin component of MazEF toxin-antitoxin module